MFNFHIRRNAYITWCINCAEGNCDSKFTIRERTDLLKKVISLSKKTQYNYKEIADLYYKLAASGYNKSAKQLMEKLCEVLQIKAAYLYDDNLGIDLMIRKEAAEELKYNAGKFIHEAINNMPTVQEATETLLRCGRAFRANKKERGLTKMNFKLRAMECEVSVEKTERIGRFTIVDLFFKNGLKATGLSRRADGDRQNRDKGFQIARGRAFKSAFLKRQGKALQSVFMG